MTYIGMSTHHLVTRAREHLQLNSNSAKSAISQHISSCQTCQNSNLDVSSFKVIRNCHNEYETKIQEALLIKKLTPRLNSQLYANGCSFLLNVFWTFFHACVCVCLIVYIVPNTVMLFHGVALFFIYLFFFSDLILLWKRYNVYVTIPNVWSYSGCYIVTFVFCQ